MEEAYEALNKIAAEGGKVLYVGTKNKPKKYVKKKQKEVTCIT